MSWSNGYAFYLPTSFTSIMIKSALNLKFLVTPVLCMFYVYASKIESMFITFSIAFEAISRSLMSFVPRYTASAVRRTRAPASTIRVANESATNKLFLIFWWNEEEELREANSIDLIDWFHLHKLIILLIYSYKGRGKMGTWIDISDRLTKTDLTKLYISQTEQSDR